MQPETNPLTCEVKITVSDSDITTAQSTENEREQVAEATKLTGGTNVTLQSGTYYVDSNVTYNTNGAGQSALNIADGATVRIYISAGATLTATGADASGMTGAGAGIRVPANATLVILGEGTVETKGGNAAAGAKGGMNVRNASVWKGDWMRTGTGGNGGGGAGAGIGGTGGNGGTGGAGGSAGTMHRTSGDHIDDPWVNAGGGGAGGAGGAGVTSGTTGANGGGGDYNYTHWGSHGGAGGNSGTAGGKGANGLIVNPDTTGGNESTVTFNCEGIRWKRIHKRKLLFQGLEN